MTAFQNFIRRTAMRSGSPDIGKQVEYLLEEEMVIDGVRYQTGYTREYIRIALKTQEDLSGTIQKGVIREFLKPDILLVFSS